MHIGIDVRLPFYQMGGISQYILHLLPALAALDSENQYSLFHLGRDGRSYTPHAAPNFQRKNVHTPSHHKLERWALGLELLPHRLDVLHSPDFIPPQWGGRRKVITVHDLNFIFYPQFLTQASMAYYANQIERAVQVADHISADSHATRHDLIEQLHVPPEKITTVHLAANPLYEREYEETAVSATLQKHNLPRDFILFVGTLEPRKNLPFLIRAYDELLQQGEIDVPLVLVGGKGWLFEEVFTTIDELGLHDKVRHLTGIFDEELAHFYHAAGVLVTPSHYEGFGLPALEAMHCGCLVIVSNRGSLPEVVGQAGMQLPLDDEVVWTDALRRVLTDSALRQKMITRGHDQAKTFTWQKAAQMTLEIYKDVV
ncbi:MAG: glycosyltransferase family 4 protein [Ardenticatenaceae bacterium]|nr:glycosyltransferase family 4 protein [Anaerolineales bacterium]MCB8941179.1 glycosyltransferase family 4 protein [Ardenticatenaceae bacterium]MCB8972517.1 glycosyltransferase family 4 protein [Ardenticatenaceae bacterium]